MSNRVRKAAPRHGDSRGFTLLEVMIVIVIILAIAGLVTYNLMGSKAEATKGTAAIQLKAIKEALKHFNLAMNRFPTDEEGLAALWDKSVITDEEDQKKWTSPFLEEPAPKDQWGSPWGYKQVGEKAPAGMFDLWSYGPDKQDGTEDDISVWKSTSESESGGSAPAGSGTSGGAKGKGG